MDDPNPLYRSLSLPPSQKSRAVAGRSCALAREPRPAEDRSVVKLGPPPWIAAHRGSAPLLENTIPALLAAVDEGADFLEVDVQSTVDDVLVLHHDATLARLAGRPDLVLEESTLRELAALELHSPDNPALDGTIPARIPTLAELFAALPAGFPVNIELKSRRTAPERLAALALEATSGRENVLFSSFDWTLLGELRRRSQEVRIAPLAKRLSPGVERVASDLGAWSLHVARGVAREDASASGSRPGPPILVYTVNEARRARALFAQGVAGVFTDLPGRLRADLGRLGDSEVLSTTYRGTRPP